MPVPAEPIAETRAAPAPAARAELRHHAPSPARLLHAVTQATHATDPATLPPSREQLLYFLHEAAEIEHNLMCCYLYAAFSLKRVDARWTDEQAQAVARWRRVITGVALEEMTHLCLVGNLMSALGAPGHFNRPNFPIDSGPYPADFVIRLQPFSRATIEHFEFLERPVTADLRDGEGFVPRRSYRRGAPAGRLSPGAKDYATVGELYATLRAGIEAFVGAHGEAALFLGDPARQVDAGLAPLPGVCAITDLASTHRALDTIVTQGEGAGDEEHDSHFCRFTRLHQEFDQLTAADPHFEPAWPAATNPVMNPPPIPDGKVHIAEPTIARWLDIGNALYTTSLRCLLQGFGTTDRTSKATWLAASFALMRAVTPVGEGLAARPARSDGQQGPNAGLTFTSLRTLAALPESRAAAFVAERLGELRDRAMALPVVPVAGETPGTWQAVIDALGRQRARIEELIPDAAATMPAAMALPSPLPAPASPAAAPTSAPAAEAAIETAQGSAITIFFEGQRCIHSRHCVLEAPSVFKANTPGEWIYPDTMAVERLVDVAHKCPSGAIRYERHDGGEAEAAPPVNTLRLRENGPYALHAEHELVGHERALRATLCRCGQSKRKPWCDGSHTAAAFTATGEPTTGAAQPLVQRNGLLTVTPLRNGPLAVAGNLELCAGTGRTVARIGAPNVAEVRLCRCGQSRNKPYCDGSHIAAGFEAAGS
jgi:CDGSH-type Zn-finger protein/uncharacterized Fe-S cluster protein YjdI